MARTSAWAAVAEQGELVVIGTVRLLVIYEGEGERSQPPECSLGRQLPSSIITWKAPLLTKRGAWGAVEGGGWVLAGTFNYLEQIASVQGPFFLLQTQTQVNSLGLPSGPRN